MYATTAPSPVHAGPTEIASCATGGPRAFFEKQRERQDPLGPFQLQQCKVYNYHLAPSPGTEVPGDGKIAPTLQDLSILSAEKNALLLLQCV